MQRDRSPSPDAAPSPGAPDPDDGRRRRISARRPLPSGRAVVGGLLVAMAMLVSFGVASGGGHGPTGRVVVARRAIRIGAHLSAADLSIERVSLPSALAAQTFAATGEVVGGVALAPIAAGGIVEPSAVSLGSHSASSAQISFPLDRNRALDGALQVGESLDLLATYGTGDTARTVVVARAVRLVDLDDDNHQGLESTGKLVVTIELRDPEAVLRVAHATQVAAVMLVRSDGSTDGPDSYSLPN